MPNTLTMSARDKDGTNSADFFIDLAAGLFSMSAAGTELKGTTVVTMDNSTLSLSNGTGVLSSQKPGVWIDFEGAGDATYDAQAQTLTLAGPNGSSVYSTSSMGTEIFGSTSWEGSYSTDGSTLGLTSPEGSTLYSMDTGPSDLSIDYETINGQIHATALTFTVDGQTEWTASFGDPEPLGFGTWTTMGTTFHDALFADIRLEFIGKAGDDTGWGTNRQDILSGKGGDDALFGWGARDTIKGGGGNDMMAGGDGSDTLFGGTGHDLLMGGKHNDKLRGQDGNDLLIAGQGYDNANGGADNDVLVLDDGGGSVRGGIGRDLFIFDSFASTGSGTPTVLRSHVRDYDPSVDVLIFAGVTTFSGGNPGDFSTLDQIANGTVEGFSWNENANGVVIRSGDARVVLHGTTADQIDLDYILFTTRNAIGTAEVFDPANGGGVLASGFNGDATLAVDAFGSTFTTTDGASWDLFSGDVTGFSSTASADPTV